MRTHLDKLQPGSLFVFGELVDPKGDLHLCLWVYPHLQLSTPDDTRVLVDFGFTRLGQAEFQVEERSWHDCNVVYTVDP